LALGEEFFTESFFFAENFFTLGEEIFTESPSFGSHQSLLLSAKALFPVVGGEEDDEPPRELSRLRASSRGRILH
jgi:hypothetical protein